MALATPPTALRYGLVGLVVFAPLMDGGTTYIPATLIRVWVLALAGIWLAYALGPGGPWRRSTPLDWPLLLLLALAAVSASTSAYGYTSLQTFHSLAAGALLLAVTAESARGERARRAIVLALVAAGVGQALLALGQVALGRDRAAGTYFNPNHLALALAMTLGLLLASRPTTRAGRVATFGAGALVVVALVASRSRGGVLAALAAVGLVGWLQWRWRALPAVALAAILLAVVPNPLSNRLRSAQGRDPLLYSRVEIWRSALARVADHPLGVGLGLFGYTAQQYPVPVEGEIARYGRHASTAHNDYLEILAELGIPGIALALWSLGALARRARRLLRGAVGREGPDPLVAGSMAALTALAVQAAVDNPLGVPGLVVQGAVLAGVLLAVPVPDESSRTEPERVPAVLGTERRPAVRACLVVAVAVAGLLTTRHGLAFHASERATLARDAGDLAAARIWLDRAAALAPDNAGYAEAISGLSLRAWRAAHDLQHAAAAEAALMRAIRIDPGTATRYAWLAEVYREMLPDDPHGRRELLRRAHVLYEEAERRNPYRMAFPFQHAQVLMLLGDDAGAEAALERAVALEPRFLPARLELARLLARRGGVEAARAHYDAIEATLAEYQATLPIAGESVFARTFLGIDREAARREAARLPEGRS